LRLFEGPETFWPFLNGTPQAIARAILGPKKLRRKFGGMLGIYNITSGEEIVKSTLFCKGRYVLYSGIKTIMYTE
jgi:hypothetical protein